MAHADGAGRGRSTRQRSKAKGQRGWKRQPAGTSSGLATSPCGTMRSRRSVGSATGIADSSACVYGCLGSRWMASREPISTISPRYITATRSDMCSTTCRSWEMKR